MESWGDQLSIFYLKNLNYKIFTHQGLTCVIGKPIIRNTIQMPTVSSVFLQRGQAFAWQRPSAIEARGGSSATEPL